MTEKRNIIAILRGITPDETPAICDALIACGISMIEVPLNSPDAFTSIGLAAKRFAGMAQIGAGTVLTPEDVERVAEAGGSFVVSPDCNPQIIARTRSKGLGSYPGVFTPTEAFAAIRAGADALKMFPAELLGPAGIRAMKAVLPPDMPVYAVGGAGPDNLGDYFAAGCAGFGVGSHFYRPGYSPDEVRQRAENFVAAYDREQPNAD